MLIRLPSCFGFREYGVDCRHSEDAAAEWHGVIDQIPILHMRVRTRELGRHGGG